MTVGTENGAAARPRLHSVLCLGADFDCSYIPHLCRHYAGTVDSWNVLLHSNDLGKQGEAVIARARSAFESSLVGASSNATLATREWRGEFDPSSKVQGLNNMVHELVPPGEWVLYLDADEFLDSPEAVKSLLVQCREDQQQVVYGQMVDRFTPDKKPVPIDDNDDLFVKFPLDEEYTRFKTRSWTHKPCLMRYDGEPLLLTCHDFKGLPWSVYRTLQRPLLTIWHFKWVETTREKLKHRVYSYQRQGLGWWPDIRRSLEDIYQEEVPEAKGSAKDTLCLWRPLRLGTVVERDGHGVFLRLHENDEGVRLNATAAAIWELADGKRTEAELVAELLELYAASESHLRHDLQKALEGLVAVGALEPEGPPAVHPLTNVDEGHLGGYIRASASPPGFSHGDPQTWEPDVWRWAVDTFAAESVLDLGCGEAHSTRYFRDLGCRVLGVDGSVRAKAASAAPDRHVRHDFVDGPFLPEEEFDLVWSCEFVEHVEERFADHFLTTFALARKAILMTFAGDGQLGWHHVNCQPESYWVEKVEGLGFLLDRKLTNQGRALARGMHFASRGLVFVRREPRTARRDLAP